MALDLRRRHDLGSLVHRDGWTCQRATAQRKARPHGPGCVGRLAHPDGADHQADDFPWRTYRTRGAKKSPARWPG